MLKKRIPIIVLCFSLFLIIGMLGSLFFLQEDLSLTEENTAEYTATVKDIKTWNVTNDTYINILTEEYGSALMVNLSVSNKMGASFLSDLSIGDEISFRIRNRMKESLETKHMGDIVALHTAEREYFSLSTYNELMRKDAVPTKIAAITISAIAFVVAIGCTLRLTGTWPFREQKRKK